MIYDEIVIGAGFAGLYWVYKTKPQKYLILEKSDRVGGRVYNIDWNGSQISLGGGIIKHDNNYTIKLAKENGFELGDGISKYQMIDWVNGNENRNGDEDKSKKIDNQNIIQSKPNEDDFYHLNTNIIKYLKKIYIMNKKEICEEKINFEQFLDLYVELKLVQIIKSNILYKTYFESDIESVLENEIDELLRTQDFHIKFIKNGGYNLLLSKLVEIVKLENIKINNCVIQIKKKNNLFEIKTNSNELFYSKKIILATESDNKIKWSIDNQSIIDKITKLYQMVSGSNYIRIYSYHKNSHGLKYSYKTAGLAGKVILINPNILMCCYTEEQDAIKLNKLLLNKTKSSQINIIHKLLNECNIPITKPDDIIIKFWNSGVHYCNPGYNLKTKNSIISELKKENIVVIGECISDSHGWVNSALESVELVLKL
jgi:hypothetical protein